jgi:predicted dehydrogenase
VKPFRLGLIGAGGISRTYLAALAHVPEADAVAVWSRTRERAAALARDHGIALATNDLTELIDAVDVVCVNSPNALHAEHAIAAAAAGRHVIVEKPLAASLDQGRALVEACRRAGVGLAYAEELAFVPKFVHARDALRRGDLGEPVYLTQREAHAGPYSPWFFTRDEAGGGVLMDMACHAIECVRFVLDKPPVRRVTAHLARTRFGDRSELEDHAVVHLEFEGAATALCEASWALLGGMQSTLEVWGTRGTIAVDLLQQTGVRQWHDERWSTPLPEYLLENGYPQELSHFLRCFADGTEPDEGGADGLAILEILHAAYVSAAERRSVELPLRAEGVARAVDPWLARRPD